MFMCCISFSNFLSYSQHNSSVSGAVLSNEISRSGQFRSERLIFIYGCMFCVPKKTRSKKSLVVSGPSAFLNTSVETPPFSIRLSL